MRKIARILLLTLGLTLGLAPAARAACQSWPSSRAVDGNLDTGPYCEGGGGGCSECIDWNTAPNVTMRACVFDLWTGASYCFFLTIPDMQQP